MTEAGRTEASLSEPLAGSVLVGLGSVNSATATIGVAMVG